MNRRRLLTFPRPERPSVDERRVEAFKTPAYLIIPREGARVNVFDEVFKRLEMIERTKSGLEQYLTA